jgi:hypothetical protein
MRMILPCKAFVDVKHDFHFIRIIAEYKAKLHANSFMKEDIMYCGTMFLFWAEFCHLVTKQRKCKS